MSVLQVVDAEGDEQFELQFGKPATDGQCMSAMQDTLFAVASGIGLDECGLILGRKVSGPTHRFDHVATEEIILNWAR
jgi:hypothetical protein